MDLRTYIHVHTCIHNGTGLRLYLYMGISLFQMATMVYAEVSVPQKFHPHIIGKKGANGEFNKHYYYLGGSNSLYVRMGESLNVEMIFNGFSTCEISCDSSCDSFSLVNKIKEETCTSISIPSDKDKSDVIRIEGDPQGVAAAKKIIVDLTNKLVGLFISLSIYPSVCLSSIHESMQ